MTNLLKWLTSRTYRQAAKRRWFYSHFLDSEDLFFDVGANMGNRIEPALQLGARVVAIEPQIACQEFLEKTFGDAITIVPKALGEKEQTMEMFVSESSTLSTLSPEWKDAVSTSGRFGETRWDQKVEVKVTTLDRLIGQFGQPKFIKIDVEGFELEVLLGLTSAIPTVSIEYAVPESLEKTQKCLERLLALDPQYHCNYSVGENMRWAAPKWRTIDEMRQFIATPEFLATDFGDIYVSNDGELVA